MDEADGLGMQGVAWADGKAVVYELPVFAEYGALYDLVPSVGVVVEKRMSYMLHVYPDLVGAPCLQHALYQGCITESFQYFIMGDGFLAVLAIGIGVEKLAKALVSAHVRDDGAIVFDEVAPYQGEVLPLDRVVEELFGQAANGFFRLGQDHESAGVLVDAVNEAKAGQVALIDGMVLLLQIPGHAIDEGAGIIAAGGMYHQTRGLVDDEHFFILIPDVEGHLFGYDLFPVDLLVGVYDDLVLRTDLVVRLYLLVVDEDHAALQCFLDLVAGGVLDALYQEFVDTHGFLPLVYLQVHALVQLFRAI